MLVSEAAGHWTLGVTVLGKGCEWEQLWPPPGDTEGLEGEPGQTETPINNQESKSNAGNQALKQTCYVNKSRKAHMRRDPVPRQQCGLACRMQRSKGSCLPNWPRPHCPLGVTIFVTFLCLRILPLYICDDYMCWHFSVNILMPLKT